MEDEDLPDGVEITKPSGKPLPDPQNAPPPGPPPPPAGPKRE